MDETTQAPAAAEPEPKPDRTIGRSTLLIAVLAAAIVAGIIGVAVGWKLEQQRVKDDLASIRPIGTVTASDPHAVTVRLSTSGGTRTYVVSSTTKVSGLPKGSSLKGQAVLVRGKTKDGKPQAVEIIVLPKEASYSRR